MGRSSRLKVKQCNLDHIAIVRLALAPDESLKVATEHFLAAGPASVHAITMKSIGKR